MVQRRTAKRQRDCASTACTHAPFDCDACAQSDFMCDARVSRQKQMPGACAPSASLRSIYLRFVLFCFVSFHSKCTARYGLAAAQGLAPAMFNLAAMHDPPPPPPHSLHYAHDFECIQIVSSRRTHTLMFSWSFCIVHAQPRFIICAGMTTVWALRGMKLLLLACTLLAAVSAPNCGISAASHALRMYLQAASQGHRGAQFTIGFMCV